MSSNFLSSRTSMWAATVGICMAVVPAGFAQRPSESPNLFIAAQAPGNLSDWTGPPALRTRPVRVDLRAIKGSEPGDSIALNLFDDTGFVGMIERIERRSATSYTLGGPLADEQGAWFVVSVERQVADAVIWRPDRGTYDLRHIQGDVHLIRELDRHGSGVCGVGLEGASRPPQGPQPLSGGCFDPSPPACIGCADDGSVIDMLVVYSPEARAAIGGTTNMLSRINTFAFFTNSAYANSGINTSVNVVLTYEVQQSESGFPVSDLDALVDPCDGVWDEVHPLRNAVGADVVSFIVEGDSIFGDPDRKVCGVARFSIQGRDDSGMWVVDSFPDLAFNAVNVALASDPDDCRVSDYTFAHELGHNQGCKHDWAGDANPGAYSYSHGHSTQSFKTMMGRMASSSGPRILSFSDPDIDFNGLPTGVPVGQPFEAHNTLSINNGGAGRHAGRALRCGLKASNP